LQKRVYPKSVYAKRVPIHAFLQNGYAKRVSIHAFLQSGHAKRVSPTRFLGKRVSRHTLKKTYYLVSTKSLKIISAARPRGPIDNDEDGFGGASGIIV
jgi:hypothetical protein